MDPSKVTIDPAQPFLTGKKFSGTLFQLFLTQVSLITMEIDLRPALLEKLFVVLQVRNTMDTRMIIKKGCYHSMQITDNVNDKRLDTDAQY